jgi:hypothetical protein
MKIILKYFLDINLFNLIYSILVGILFLTPKYIPICFGTLGTIIGYWSYNYFFKNEYFFYFNLGYSKKKLILIVWSINLAISILTFIILK